MMKLTVIFLLLLSFTFSYGQENVVAGRWIIDKCQYINGKSLEIDHPLYASFIVYEIGKDALIINGTKLAADIGQSSIKTNSKTLDYFFNGTHLVIQDPADGMEYRFLEDTDYATQYPEFKKRDEANVNLYVGNDIVRPIFKHDLTFEQFLTENIPSYNATSATNAFFKAEFVLTKDNQIQDVKIIHGISKRFDEQFVKALEISRKFWFNGYDKDLLLTQKFNFFKLFDSYRNKEEEKLDQIIRRGSAQFEKYSFPQAIAIYEELMSLDLQEDLRDRFGFSLKKAFVNLGICYLVQGNAQKACEAFHQAGDITDFTVRNFIINFCKPRENGLN